MRRQWPLGSEVKRKDLTGGAMLYDASRAGNATASWFEPAFWQERGEIEGEARGRGAVQFIKTGEKAFVLRHYRRGGLIAQLAKDRYVWRGEAETRAWREWQLLYHLHRAGLPVPTPVAARYRRQGLTYSADLITERLADSESLASLLRKRPRSKSTRYTRSSATSRMLCAFRSAWHTPRLWNMRMQRPMVIQPRIGMPRLRSREASDSESARRSVMRSAEYVSPCRR